MMFSLCFDPAQEITLPISCDPSIVEANSDAAIEAYQETSDPGPLLVPDDGTLITIALDPARLADARDRAGQVPMLGERVGAHARAAGGELGPDASIEEQQAAELAIARAFDALDEEERQALVAYRAWQQRISLEVVCAAIVRVRGWDLEEHGIRESIEAIRPVSHREAFIAEAYVHISRLERLDPEKKTQSALRSGQPIPSGEHGDAHNARSRIVGLGATVADRSGVM